MSKLEKSFVTLVIRLYKVKTKSSKFTMTYTLQVDAEMKIVMMPFDLQLRKYLDYLRETPENPRTIVNKKYRNMEWMRRKFYKDEP